ncbi:Multidrug resistance-associated protein 5 [Phlyctochytrium bullatum]|nr:Multidrug resistance-associated protein 5 [Phlyctochytrium bullatum]
MAAATPALPPAATATQPNSSCRRRRQHHASREGAVAGAALPADHPTGPAGFELGAGMGDGTGTGAGMAVDAAKEARILARKGRIEAKRLAKIKPDKRMKPKAESETNDARKAKSRISQNNKRIEITKQTTTELTTNVRVSIVARETARRHEEERKVDLWDRKKAEEKTRSDATRSDLVFDHYDDLGKEKKRKPSDYNDEFSKFITSSVSTISDILAPPTSPTAARAYMRRRSTQSQFARNVTVWLCAQRYDPAWPSEGYPLHDQIHDYVQATGNALWITDKLQQGICSKLVVNATLQNLSKFAGLKNKEPKRTVSEQGQIADSEKSEMPINADKILFPAMQCMENLNDMDARLVHEPAPFFLFAKQDSATFEGTFIAEKLYYGEFIRLLCVYADMRACYSTSPEQQRKRLNAEKKERNVRPGRSIRKTTSPENMDANRSSAQKLKRRNSVSSNTSSPSLNPERKKSRRTESPSPYLSDSEESWSDISDSVSDCWSDYSDTIVRRSCLQDYSDFMTPEAMKLTVSAFSQDRGDKVGVVEDEEEVIEEGDAPPPVNASSQLNRAVKQKRLPIVYKAPNAIFLSCPRTCQELFDARAEISEPLGKLNTVSFNPAKAMVVCGHGTKISSGKAPEGSLLVLALPGNSLKPHLIANLNHTTQQLDQKLKAKIKNLHKVNETFDNERKNALSRAIRSLWNSEFVGHIFVELKEVRETAKAAKAKGKYQGKSDVQPYVTKDLQRDGDDFIKSNENLILEVVKLIRDRLPYFAELQDMLNHYLASRYRKNGPPLRQTYARRTAKATKRWKRRKRLRKQKRKAKRKREAEQKEAAENEAPANAVAPKRAIAKSTAAKKRTLKKTLGKKAIAKKETPKKAFAKKSALKKAIDSDASDDNASDGYVTDDEATETAVTGEAAKGKAAAKKAATKKIQKRVKGLPIGGLFSTLVYNRLCQTDPHKDTGDLPGGWCVVVPCGKFKGGKLRFPETGLQFNAEERMIENANKMLDLQEIAALSLESLKNCSATKKLLSTVATFIVMLVASLTGVSPSLIGSAGLAEKFLELISSLSEAEAEFVSAERLLEHIHDLPNEGPRTLPTDPPESAWPTSGAVAVQGLEVHYEGLDRPALHNVTFELRPGEKLGIVGRTGSGKSTLMAALFRLVEPTSGRMTVDGRDLAKLGRTPLRLRLHAIPQDAQLFNVTLRSNLEPYDEVDDARLWAAVESVGLRDWVSGLPKKLQYVVERARTPTHCR